MKWTSKLTWNQCMRLTLALASSQWKPLAHSSSSSGPELFLTAMYTYRPIGRSCTPHSVRPLTAIVSALRAQAHLSGHDDEGEGLDDVDDAADLGSGAVRAVLPPLAVQPAGLALAFLGHWDVVRRAQVERPRGVHLLVVGVVALVEDLLLALKVQQAVVHLHAVDGEDAAECGQEERTAQHLHVRHALAVEALARERVHVHDEVEDHDEGDGCALEPLEVQRPRHQRRRLLDDAGPVAQREDTVRQKRGSC